jgi:hypothetical protein
MASTGDLSYIDLVGPWKVRTPSGIKTLRAFTAIDPAT